VRTAGFTGPVWPVNPRHADVLGLPCYPNVAALPGVPDLAVIATPPATVPGLIAEVGGRGTRAAVVLTAGLTRENGLRQAMLDAAKPRTLRIIGPNCLGLFVPGIGLNASFAHIAPQPGRLAFLSQSGALASAVLDWAAERHIGFSTVVSLGDMADVDVADLLDMLAGDPATRAVLLYLETVTNTRKFMSAARAAARLKPVIVIKSGRHAAAAKAAATHTGALAGTDGAVNAAFRRAGLLRVTDLEELFDAAETLARFAPIDRGRLAIVTNGGGAGVLAVDQLVDFAGEMAALSAGTIAALDKVLPPTWSHANPVDIIGDAGPERYKAALETVFADPEVDALLVMACPTALASAEASAAAVVETVKAIDASHPPKFKPIMTSWLGEHSAAPARARFRDAGIATYDTPADAVRSLSYLTGYSAAQRALIRTPPSMSADVAVDAAGARTVLARTAADGRTLLSEPEAKQTLAAFGVPVVETLVAKDAAEVKVLAGQLLARHPAVVVKLLSHDISHKSDVGGVVLGLRSPASAERAANGITERLAAKAPQATIDGFTVQAMINRPRAHELIIGVSEDPLFGPIILFGAGQMMVDCPEIASLDINPLIADENGAIALDARVVVDPKRIGEPAPNRRLSIRPYPSAWEKRVRTSGNVDLQIRPIRPDDAHLYGAFVSKLDRRDVRLRLLAPRKHFSHEFLARLTQIDYAREMAFVGVDPASGALLGVARLVSDPDYTRAEYAVIVRSDLQGSGIGWALMEHLLAYAKGEGLAVVEGMVLAENSDMLTMCRELGFSILPDPADPGCLQVRIALADAP
jgi:acetyltransferase